MKCHGDIPVVVLRACRIRIDRKTEANVCKNCNRCRRERRPECCWKPLPRVHLDARYAGTTVSPVAASLRAPSFRTHRLWTRVFGTLLLLVWFSSRSDSVSVRLAPTPAGQDRSESPPTHRNVAELCRRPLLPGWSPATSATCGRPAIGTIAELRNPEPHPHPGCTHRLTKSLAVAVFDHRAEHRVRLRSPAWRAVDTPRH